MPIGRAISVRVYRRNGELLAHHDLGATDDLEVVLMPRRRKKKRSFTVEEKREFVRLLEASGKTIEEQARDCLLYTSPSPRDLSTSRMPSSA